MNSIPSFIEVLSYPFSIRSPTLTYKYFLIKKKKLGLKENKILTWLVRFFAVNSFILRSACFYQGGFFFFFFSHFVWLVSVDRILKKETILKILNSLFLCIFNLICGLRWQRLRSLITVVAWSLFIALAWCIFLLFQRKQFMESGATCVHCDVRVWLKYASCFSFCFLMHVYIYTHTWLGDGRDWGVLWQ